MKPHYRWSYLFSRPMFVAFRLQLDDGTWVRAPLFWQHIDPE